MPGSNQFLPFAIGSGANTLTPAAYAALTPLVNLGFQSGVAQSVEFNTVLRQCAFVASAIAQLIADATGSNVLDNGVVLTFEEQLANAIDLCLYGLDTGSANAYNVTYAVPITAIADGIRLRFRALHANTGASTFNPSGLGAQPIYSSMHAALIAGEIVVGGDVEVVWNSTLAGWVLLECTGGSQQLPAGTYGVTATTGDSSTKVSTTAFVATAITAALVTAASAATATQIGIGQTWQQFTVGTARILGTVYTNTGAKPLAISFDSNGNTSGNAALTIGGLVVGSSGGDTTNGAAHSQIFGIVPPGGTYSVTSSRATNNWYELR